MRRKFFLAFLVGVIFPASVVAQTLDLFRGNALVSCPTSAYPGAPGYSDTATCSQVGFVVTCNLPAGHGSRFSQLQIIIIGGTATALATTFNNVTKLGGEDIIPVGGISGDTITLTSPVSATVGSTSVTFTDGHYYVPRDASGNVIPVSLPGWGNRLSICTPQAHQFELFAIGNPCASYAPGGGCAAPGNNPANASGNVTRLSNIATLHLAGANFRWNFGAPVTVLSCADPTYNISPTNITFLSSDGLTIQYNDPGLDDPTGTAGCQIKGFGWNPAKYTSFAGTQPDARCNTQLGQFMRYLAMGFDALGETGDDFLDPTRSSPCNIGPSNSNTFQVPIFTGESTPAASNNAAANLFGCATQGPKAPMYTIKPAVTDLLKNSAIIYDWADPHWISWMNCNWDPVTGRNPFTIAEIPWQVGLVFDDTDGMMQTHAAGVWQTFGNTGPSPEPALLTLYGAPYISTSDHSNITSGVLPRLYPDTCNYSKDLAVDCGLPAPSVCTDAAPCSLADTLRVEYTAINPSNPLLAFNTAWGTSYTTFGSTRSIFTGETITTPASYTFAHTNITPRSVQLFLTPSGGSPVMVTGGCSLNDFDCPAGTAGQATFLAPPNCALSTPYMTVGIVCKDTNGDVEEVTTAGTTGTSATYPATTNCSGTQTTVTSTVTFTCIGPSITGNLVYATGVASLTVGGGGVIPTGEALTTNYSTGGWNLGGTGLEDEDGTGTSGVGVSIINGVNLVCPQTYAVGISVTARRTEVAFVNGGLTYWAIALTSGTTADPNAATEFTTTEAQIITTSDGLQWEMLGKPVSDATNAATNGYPTPCAVFSAINATRAADLQAYEQQFFDFYFKGLNSVSSKYHVLNFGANFGFGSYNTPTWLGGLIAANKYTDAIFVGSAAALGPASSFAPLDKLTFDYVFSVFHHPAISEYFLASCAGDWQGNAKACSPSGQSIGQFNGLVARANAFYQIIQGELNYIAPDGTRPWDGFDWWTDHANDNGSNTGETSFALLDYSDNRINGIENVAASVPCSAPLSSLTCGGELSTVPWLGIDEEHCTGTAFVNQCIADGLALPFNSVVTKPTARPRGIIWGQAFRGKNTEKANTEEVKPK